MFLMRTEDFGRKRLLKWRPCTTVFSAQRGLRQGSARLDFDVHVENPLLYNFMLAEQLVALDPPLRVVKRFLVSGSCQARKNRAQARASMGEYLDQALLVAIDFRDTQTMRDANICEDNLPMIQLTLADLVEHLASRNARQVQGNEKDVARGRPLRFDRDVGERVSCDRPVSDPGRLVSAEHIGIAFRAGDQLAGNLRITELSRANRQHIRAVIWFAHSPASNQGRTAVARELPDEAFHQFGLLRSCDACKRNRARQQRACQPRAAPAQLFKDNLELCSRQS